MQKYCNGFSDKAVRIYSTTARQDEIMVISSAKQSSVTLFFHTNF